MPPKPGYTHNKRPCSNPSCGAANVGRWGDKACLGTCKRPICFKRVSRLLPADQRTKDMFLQAQRWVEESAKEPNATLDAQIHQFCKGVRERVARCAAREKQRMDEEAKKRKEAEAEAAREREKTMAALLMTQADDFFPPLPDDDDDGGDGGDGEPKKPEPEPDGDLMDYDDYADDYGEREGDGDDPDDRAHEAKMNI
jgi:hypothetical protein